MATVPTITIERVSEKKAAFFVGLSESPFTSTQSSILACMVLRTIYGPTRKAGMVFVRLII